MWVMLLGLLEEYKVEDAAHPYFKKAPEFSAWRPVYPSIHFVWPGPVSLKEIYVLDSIGLQDDRLP